MKLRGLVSVCVYVKFLCPCSFMHLVCAHMCVSVVCVLECECV